MKKGFPGLYAIADVDTLHRRGLDVERAARAMLLGGPVTLQLRAKRAGAADTLAWLRALRAPAHDAGCELFANDRADLAQAAGCDGVHVGQDDLSLAEVRRSFPELRVGVSTHDEAQLRGALAERPDYVALGPVFSTVSKENPEPTVGISTFERLGVCARDAAVPLVAIGGITLESAERIANAGASVALIGALLPDSTLGSEEAYAEITRRTQRLAALFRSAAS